MPDVPAQVREAEFPQIDLEVIDDARHDFLDCGHVLRVCYLDQDADLQEAGTAASGVVQVDHHVGDTEEHLG